MSGTNFKRVIQEKLCNWITTHHSCFLICFTVFVHSLMLIVVFPKVILPKTLPCHNFQGSGGQYGPTGSMLDRSAVTTGVFNSLLTAENQLSQHCLCQCCRGKDVQLRFVLFCLVRKAQMYLKKKKEFLTINRRAAAVLMKYRVSYCY